MQVSSGFWILSHSRQFKIQELNYNPPKVQVKPDPIGTFFARLARAVLARALAARELAPRPPAAGADVIEPTPTIGAAVVHFSDTPSTGLSVAQPGLGWHRI
jgi:hypothetical protein